MKLQRHWDPTAIALAAGVHCLYPETSTLVIDAGTCMTRDVVDRGTFRGGAISPGLSMRLKAMSSFTSSLPDLSGKWKDVSLKDYGKNTAESMVSGAAGGMTLEIEGAIERFRKDFSSENVIMTGGDAHFFESRVKAHIFAGSKIVETGLYRIWNHQ